MPFNNVTDRTDVGALIPEDVSNELWALVPQQSAALTLFRQVPMTRAQQRVRVLSALPVAYFVNGDTGLKQTTEMAWANKYLDAEEIAVIMPVPENVAADVDVNIFDSARPLLIEAMGRTLDAAVFFGTNKPATWPAAIVPAAVAAGNVVARGTNAVTAGGVVQDIYDVFSTVEADGYVVDGIVANSTLRGRLRGARDNTGQGLLDANRDGLDGAQITYAMRGQWPTGLSAAEAVVGDFTNGIIGIRSDVNFKLLDQAAIFDNTGTLIYNLPQQDMIALRLTFRVAYQVSNPLNYDQPVEASRYPFGILRSPAA